MKILNKLNIMLVILTSIVMLSCTSNEEEMNETSTLTVQNTELSINENSASGTVIGKIEATTTSGTISFTTKTSDANGAILIENDGTVKVDDVSELDYEIRQKITVELEVTNGTDTQEIVLAVTILDVDDASFITVSDFEVSVNENTASGQVLEKLTATTSEGTLSFSIKSSDGNGAITVDSDGTLKVGNVAELDFEKRQQITAVITVTNGTISEDFNLIVRILDVDETTVADAFSTDSIERGIVGIANTENAIKIEFQGKNFENIIVLLHNSVKTMPTEKTTYNISFNPLSSSDATVTYTYNENNTLVTYGVYDTSNAGTVTIEPKGDKIYEISIENAALKNYFNSASQEFGTLNYSFTGIEQSIAISTSEFGEITGENGITGFKGLEKSLDIVSLTTQNVINFSRSIQEVTSIFPPTGTKYRVDIAFSKTANLSSYKVVPIFFNNNLADDEAIVNVYTGLAGENRYMAQSGTIEVKKEGDFYTVTFTNLPTKRVTGSTTNPTLEDTDNTISVTITGERRKFGSFVDN